ncbi:hypothetical protein T01_11433 [Trichinella spiralis]|uniref:Uncharacterized protein n=1 Tax=Trichinella spiralis TaxID=6334 RepID=A0A0V1BZD9_TRISP|nr:hypothetical protein T01_11433 [Trichinella spiralis]
MEKAQAVHHPTRFLRTQQLGRLNFALLFVILSQLTWHLIDHSACLDTRYYCPMYTYHKNGRVISCVLLEDLLKATRFTKLVNSHTIFTSIFELLLINWKYFSCTKRATVAIKPLRT